MARTRDFVVLSNGVVYNLSKSKYKAFLSARAEGSTDTLASFGARVVVAVDKDVSAITSSVAQSELAALSPVASAVAA